MSNIRDHIARLPFVDTDDPVGAARRIVREWKEGGGSTVIHYMYYASYVQLHSDSDVLENYLAADYILIDGIGMQMYCKAVTGIKPANLNGTDMSPIFFEMLHEIGAPVCLYGTTKENIDKCAEKLRANFGESMLAYHQDGFSPLDLDQVPEGSALFIGMGSPRQERWVRDHLNWIREKKLIVFTVGGFFDFLSGFYIRAPKWVRAIKMEWAWRTMLHPGRHYQKRLRDTTITFKPFLDKLKGYAAYLHFKRL
jgi:exopolysaccharide biosynthesis WecB/TagA/CpsF family protein